MKAKKGILMLVGSLVIDIAGKVIVHAIKKRGEWSNY